MARSGENRRKQGPHAKVVEFHAGRLEREDAQQLPVRGGGVAGRRVDAVAEEPHEVLRVPEADAQLRGEGAVQHPQRVLDVLRRQALRDGDVFRAH